jgi:hypothetical protein
LIEFGPVLSAGLGSYHYDSLSELHNPELLGS